MNAGASQDLLEMDIGVKVRHELFLQQLYKVNKRILCYKIIS